MRAWPTCFLLIAVAGTVVAQEQPPARPDSGDDGISAARRDLDLIKASRGSAAQSKGELPRIAVPEIHVAASSALPLPSQKKPSEKGGKDAKSKTWLLDAMQDRLDERKDRTSPRNGRKEIADEDELLAGVSGERSQDRDASGETRTERNEREELERRDNVENPLVRYSAEWMTAQDYALMRPVLEGMRAGDAASTSTLDLLGTNTIPGPAAPGGADGPMVFGAVKVFTPAVTHENPYLQVLNAPVTPSTWTPPPSPIVNTPTSPAPVPSMPPIAEPVSKSKIPDFVRPVDDEKYFKQLKRF